MSNQANTPVGPCAAALLQVEKDKDEFADKGVASPALGGLPLSRRSGRQDSRCRSAVPADARHQT